MLSDSYYTNANPFVKNLKGCLFGSRLTLILQWKSTALPLCHKYKQIIPATHVLIRQYLFRTEEGEQRRNQLRHMTDITQELP